MSPLDGGDKLKFIVLKICLQASMFHPCTPDPPDAELNPNQTNSTTQSSFVSAMAFNLNL